MPNRIRTFMMTVVIVESEKIQDTKRMTAIPMFYEMINKMIEFNHLRNEVSGCNNLNCQYEKQESFHHVKIGISETKQEIDREIKKRRLIKHLKV
jgi:hypothetical protein